MSLLTLQKLKFTGPDPPFDPPKKEEEEAQEEVKTSKASTNKKGEEVPVEIELTEEEQQEMKFFDEFMPEFTASVEQAQADLGQYRALIHPENGVERVALWPRTFTA